MQTLYKITVSIFTMSDNIDNAKSDIDNILDDIRSNSDNIQDYIISDSKQIELDLE